MSRSIILYAVATLQLVVGFFILVSAHPDWQAGEITALNYAARGIGPLLLAVAFLILARKLRAQEGLNDA